MGSSPSQAWWPMVGAGLACWLFPIPALAASFDFSSDPATNTPIKTFVDQGLTLTVGGSNSTGELNNGTVNTNNNGLCMWSRVGLSDGVGRCGFGGADPNGGISRLQFTFDQPVRINSFAVTGFDSPYISSGTIGFSLDNTNFTTLQFTGNGPQTISFEAQAGQTIYILTSAVTSTAEQTGVFRINQLNVSQVPAPLPLLGLGLAFSQTHKLQRLSHRLNRFSPSQAEA
ncbi:MAG: hypothetical protein VKP70_04390 [Cyanobacteriota bacterium]|nr:hypothetical protein [Cyanobacteriota bacterium]